MRAPATRSLLFLALAVAFPAMGQDAKDDPVPVETSAVPETPLGDTTHATAEERSDLRAQVLLDRAGCPTAASSTTRRGPSWRRVASRR